MSHSFLKIRPGAAAVLGWTRLFLLTFMILHDVVIGVMTNLVRPGC